MCMTTLIQFGVLMFDAAETQNQTTQADSDCNQLTHTLASKIPANKVNRYGAMHRGSALYPGFFCCFIFFMKGYQSLADNTQVGWKQRSFRTHQVQIKPEHGKQANQFYMP